MLSDIIPPEWACYIYQILPEWISAVIFINTIRMSIGYQKEDRRKIRKEAVTVNK